MDITNKKPNNALPQVVLIGRTNVGKSTLFNKLAEKYESMVSDIAGTTRDIKKTTIRWGGIDFELIDTGGLTGEYLIESRKLKAESQKLVEETIDSKIVRKAIYAVKSAGLIVLIADIKDGILPEDRAIVTWLQKRNYKTIVVVNKVDKPAMKPAAAEFYQLGIGDPVPVSAASGAGTGDLLDIIVAQLKKCKKNSAPKNEATQSESRKQKAEINVAIIGKPNVGKSSLLNKLLGEDRVIVSATPHTTREPIDTHIIYNGIPLTLVDTAGIRKKARIPFKSLEKHGVALSLKSIKRADVVLLIVDSIGDVGRQDAKLVQEILKHHKGIIIILNKIDELEDLKTIEHAHVIQAVQQYFNFVSWAPVVLTSALTGKNVHKIFSEILNVHHNANQIIAAEKLHNTLALILKKSAPPKKRFAHKPPKIITIKQLSSNPQRFEVVYKGTGMLPVWYLNNVEKVLRETFNFAGCPIIISQYKVMSTQTSKH